MGASLIRQLIDKVMLRVGDTPTRQNNLLPITVNMIVWRMRLNKLPTKLNLDKNGFEVDTIFCPFCDSNIEILDRIVYPHRIAPSIWIFIGWWWDL